MQKNEQSMQGIKINRQVEATSRKGKGKEANTAKVPEVRLPSQRRSTIWGALPGKASSLAVLPTTSQVAARMQLQADDAQRGFTSAPNAS